MEFSTKNSMKFFYIIHNSFYLLRISFPMKSNKPLSMPAYRGIIYTIWIFLIVYMSFLREFQTTEILIICLLVGTLQWVVTVKSMAQGMIAVTISKKLQKRFEKYRNIFSDSDDTLPN